MPRDAPCPSASLRGTTALPALRSSRGSGHATPPSGPARPLGARRSRARAWLLGLGLGIAALAGSAPSPVSAASYNPELTWRTLTTEHFRIHFHGGEERLADETAQLAEEIWAEMTEELRWSPRLKTELVLVDNTDSANGYAMTLPMNTIVIYVTAPYEDSTLSHYEDWTDGILTHEYTHILHIDNTEGMIKGLRMVFGRIVSTNRLSPGWVTEGFATFQETVHTPWGRGRSSIADMIKRMTVLEAGFPRLGNLDGFQVAPPGGNLRYLFGQDFQQWVAEHKGQHVWTDFIHHYGGGLPYLLPGRRSFGEPLPKLYKDWRRATIAEYEAQAAEIRAQGLTEHRILNDPDDQCAAPTFSPDGARLVWSCNDLERGSKIELADGNGENIVNKLDQRYATDFAWSPGGESFAFSALHLVDRFNIYSDLYLYELEGGFEALTNGDRARTPAFSPDGTRLLAVQNEAQENRLIEVRVDRSERVLFDPGGHTQLATPRFSPDGRHIAMTVWHEGRRDIWIADETGTPVRRVTNDEASDIDPRFSADGRTLLFASDRTGVFNIYAVDLETERLYQVTNVLGGAFSPSLRADGQALVFETYSGDGMDIAFMDVDRTQWRDRGVLPLPLQERAPLAQVLPGPDWVQPPPGEPKAPRDAKDVRAPDKERKFRVRKGMEPGAARVARRGAAVPSQGAPGAATEMMLQDRHVSGMDGMGGPLQVLGGLPGSWGRPGDPVAHGEFPSDLPVMGGLPDAPGGGPDVDDPSRTGNAGREEKDYDFSVPVERYNPWPTLPPRYVAPGVSLTQNYGLLGSLGLSGTDTLRRYLYSAYVSYRTDAQFVGWGVSASLNTKIPVYTVGLYTRATDFGANIWVQPGPDAEGGPWLPTLEQTDQTYWEKRTTGYAQVSWPVNEYQSVFARWSGERRRSLFDLPDGVYIPFLPTQGFLSSVGGGWTLARGRAYARSISAEQARILTFTGDLSHPYLGSWVTAVDEAGEVVATGFNRLQLTGEWREYRTAPWADNHVFATRLAGGASLGDELTQGSFRLGGSFGESSAYTLPSEFRPLRGFPQGAVFGDWYYLASGEYRLPLWWLDRGFGLLPVFARSTSLAAFVDAGNAFNDPATQTGLAAQTRIGTGLEVRASAIVAWGIPLTLRAGYGFAAYGDGGIPFGNIAGSYLQLGSSF